MLPMSVARSSSGTFLIGQIDYRREGVLFPVENALSARKGGMGVHSVGAGRSMLSTIALLTIVIKLSKGVFRNYVSKHTCLHAPLFHSQIGFKQKKKGKDFTETSEMTSLTSCRACCSLADLFISSLRNSSHASVNWASSASPSNDDDSSSFSTMLFLHNASFSNSCHISHQYTQHHCIVSSSTGFINNLHQNAFDTKQQKNHDSGLCSLLFTCHISSKV